MTDRSSKTASRGRTPAKPAADTGQDPRVAQALRTAYDEAVKEDIPAEFLDLLNKLA